MTVFPREAMHNLRPYPFGLDPVGAHDHTVWGGGVVCGGGGGTPLIPLLCGIYNLLPCVWSLSDIGCLGADIPYLIL